MSSRFSAGLFDWGFELSKAREGVSWICIAPVTSCGQRLSDQKTTSRSITGTTVVTYMSYASAIAHGTQRNDEIQALGLVCSDAHGLSMRLLTVSG